MLVQVEDLAGLVEKIDRLEEELRNMGRRLDRSERSGRRLSRLAGVGTFLAAVLLIAGGAVLVQQFNRVDVVGPNNDIRVSMAVDPTSGSAGLEIFGLNGRKLIFLGTSREGLPNLAFYDPTGDRIVREFAP